MPELDSIRASDTERDAAATRLQAASAEGRLDDTEFDQRMRAALTARTRADLAQLMTDLPANGRRARRSPGGPPRADRLSTDRAGRPQATILISRDHGVLAAIATRTP